MKIEDIKLGKWYYVRNHHRNKDCVRIPINTVDVMRVLAKDSTRTVAISVSRKVWMEMPEDFIDECPDASHFQPELRKKFLGIF